MDDAFMFFQQRDMRMACDEHVARRERRQRKMPVGDKAASAGVENRRVVAHHGEFKEHLVDFRVAVAADGENLFFLRVEQRREIGGIVADGQHVAGAVVEVVAAEDEIIRVFALEGVDGELEGVCGAVDV